jgi:HlyD family secretion protein
VANEERWMSREVKEVRTEVAREANADLKPGFSCDAEIVTDAIASALYLPLSAVFKADGRHVVYLAPQGRRQEVRVGRASTRFVEILEGLKEGDRVWLNPPETPGVPR